MKDEHAIRTLCQVMEVSRSGYYDWCREAPRRAAAAASFQAEVARIHAASEGTYGSPRVTHALHRAGHKVGHNRVARVLRESGLQGRTRRRYRVRTTDSAHDHPIAPNRLPDLPAPVAPNQVWVTDITYVETGEGWLYLAGVLDLYSRRLVGWAMSSSLATALPLAALHMALTHRRPPPGLVHHSDRGVQYASTDYRHVLHQNGLIASMSRRGNCYDNATMESFWSTLKHELIYRRRFPTRAAATTAIFAFIERFYNRVRLHSSLDYQSPLDFETLHATSTQAT
jgi:putative transposase